MPTLGEYASVIEWLHKNRDNTVIMPDDLRAIYDDALARAALRHFARAMNDALGPEGPA